MQDRKVCIILLQNYLGSKELKFSKLHHTFSAQWKVLTKDVQVLISIFFRNYHFPYVKCIKFNLNNLVAKLDSEKLTREMQFFEDSIMMRKSEDETMEESHIVLILNFIWDFRKTKKDCRVAFSENHHIRIYGAMMSYSDDRLHTFFFFVIWNEAFTMMQTFSKTFIFCPDYSLILAKIPITFRLWILYCIFVVLSFTVSSSKNKHLRAQ